MKVILAIGAAINVGCALVPPHTDPLLDAVNWALAAFCALMALTVETSL